MIGLDPASRIATRTGSGRLVQTSRPSTPSPLATCGMIRSSRTVRERPTDHSSWRRSCDQPIARSSNGSSAVVGASALAMNRNAPATCSRRYARDTPRPKSATTSDSYGVCSLSVMRSSTGVVTIKPYSTPGGFVRRTCGDDSSCIGDGACSRQPPNARATTTAIAANAAATTRRILLV